MAIGTGARAAGHAMEPYAAMWRVTCVGVVAVWLLTIAVYWPTVSTMVQKWYQSGTFAHGFLIPPVALYFGWQLRRAFFRDAPVPALWATALIGVAGLLWMIGDLASVLVLQQIAVVALVELVLLTAVGPRATRALAFPLVFLWFAVPVGEFLTDGLQDFTAWFAVQALRWSGVPVLVEGRAITLPSSHWLVAEACSGVRYVIPSVALGVLFAWLTYQSWRRRLAFVLFSVVVPVLANGLRAYGIIMLAYFTDNHVAVGIDHLIYGWVFFAVVMLLLFVVGGRWREPRRDGHSSLPRDPVIMDMPHAASRVPLALALAAVVAACPPVLSATWFADVPGEAGTLRVPVASEPWTEITGEALKPIFHGAAGQISQTYASGASDVHLYVAHYVSERQGEELVSSENRLAERPEWMLIDTRPVQAQLDSRSLTVQQQMIRSRSGQTRVIWTWYWVSGQPTLSPVVAKWLRVKGRLLRQPYDAGAIVLSTEHSDNRPGQPVLQDFLDHCSALAQPVRG
jgi:exosortase A